jgi:geranylgeranyl pyrophosphate synthase
VVGGGSAASVAALREYGELFGIAFQMKDDLLDMTADERSLGKPVGNDLTERKVTIPLIEALAGGDGNFRTEVRRFYDETANDAIASIVAGIDRQGGLRGTRDRIAAFVDRAKQSLEPLAKGTAKNELLDLADALLAE